MINFKNMSSLGCLDILGYYKQEKQFFTRNQVEKHNNSKDGFWITYKNEVYDISNYINYHPGGKAKILSAVGGAVEPHWNIYQQHLNNPHVKDILKKTKIGILSDYDPDFKNYQDPYQNDPSRDTSLVFHQIKPCNAETPLDFVMDNWITPNNLWYIRNHHPVPVFTDTTINLYRLYIGKREFTLDKIKKKYPHKQITATMQCGGNRRKELNTKKVTSGIPWSSGAISNACWKGVSLESVLKDTFTRKQLQENKYVNFTSYDGVNISIDLNHAIDPNKDVLIAFEMNGQEIPLDHGYPLRLIVPGFIGIRNLKWLKSICLSKTQVNSSWQTGLSYKILPDYLVNLQEIDISKYPCINNLPVQSVIVNTECLGRNTKVEGFAWSGSGRKIIRVDVSGDGGNTWKSASLKQGSEQTDGKAWAWTFWGCQVDTSNIKNPEIVVKAIDSTLSTQPKNIDNIWNIRGLANNSWHRYKPESTE